LQKGFDGPESPPYMRPHRTTRRSSGADRTVANISGTLSLGSIFEEEWLSRRRLEALWHCWKDEGTCGRRLRSVAVFGRHV